jgi:hypothetical protein
VFTTQLSRKDVDESGISTVKHKGFAIRLKKTVTDHRKTGFPFMVHNGQLPLSGKLITLKIRGLFLQASAYRGI